MHNVPAFKRELPSRKPGKFATWPFGKFLEWITHTWWRFNVSMISVAILIGVVVSPAPIDLKLVQYILSVPAAMLVYPVVKISFFIVSFIPLVNVPVGFSRVLYYTVFSRLVVEVAPAIYMPIWFKF